ncbi:MAG: hypothetical protein H8E35_02770 [Ardenticatenia bacterium]|nr:hypothetical protein [Ardenticatenia bacterium]
MMVWDELRLFVNDGSGQTVIEYAILTVVMLSFSATILLKIGEALQCRYACILSELSSSPVELPPGCVCG